MTKNLGTIVTASMMIAVLSVPLPAAAGLPKAAVTSGTKSPSKTRTTSSHLRHLISRFRGGVPTYADSFSLDDPTFDDPMVREAALEGLGRFNGSVVAIDPNTGRILTVVNQKIAFGDGYIPCSTIKPTVALAALEENVITRDTMLKVHGRTRYMNLTEALAHSNNEFFE